MVFSLPELPYAFDSLEPFIDAQTMEIHHGKHHQAYVDNLNKAIEGHPELASRTIEDLLSDLDSLPDEIKAAVQNNGGGHFNHSFFWPLMKKNGGGEPKGELAETIAKSFGSLKEFQAKFNDAGLKRFGSGWAWLSVTGSGQLEVVSTANQESPVSKGLKPLLGLDVWEHAYYLKYQNRRADYIAAWWHIVNWDQVEENFGN